MKYITKKAVVILTISIVISLAYTILTGFNLFNLINGLTVVLCLNFLSAIFTASAYAGDFAMFSRHKVDKSIQTIRAEKRAKSKDKVNPFYFSTLIILLMILVLNYLY